MDSIALIGFTAGIITVISFYPQAHRAWRTRSTRDLSMLSYCMMSVATILWLTYGLLKSDWPIILPNAVNLMLLSSIVVAKLRFK